MSSILKVSAIMYVRLNFLVSNTLNSITEDGGHKEAFQDDSNNEVPCSSLKVAHSLECF